MLKVYRVRAEEIGTDYAWATSHENAAQVVAKSIKSIGYGKMPEVWRY